MNSDQNHVLLFHFEGETYDAIRNPETGEFQVLCGAGDPLLTRSANGRWRAFKHVSHSHRGTVMKEAPPPPPSMVRDLEDAYKGTLGVLN
jgi:hypothetical protein